MIIMNKKIYKFDINNLVAVDGFHFSGSSIVNDIFEESGYVVPKDIRADELFHSSNNFSWPRALDNEYTYFKRFILTWRLFRTMLLRIPVNIIQKTPIYNKYLVSKGRGERMHESTSVNRSLWSYLVSVYMIICRHNYNENSFVKWLGLKYRWQVNSNKNLLLDNGIPRDQRIADWFFGINGSMGIFVYRDPRIQFQQIDQVYKSTGKITPSYDDFLSELESQYQSINWILSSNHRIIHISFDKFLNDINYRNKLEVHFKQMNMISEMNYDFSESIKNNKFLSSLSEKIVPSKKSIKTEDIIRSYHESFENKLYDSIGH
jgi:hypothetical protein